MDIKDLIDKTIQIIKNTNKNLNLLNDQNNFLLMKSNEVSDLEATFYDPVICLILQGRKKLVTGDRQLIFGKGEYLIVSHSVPVVSQILEASTQTPYIALVLGLNISIIRSLFEELGDSNLNLKKTKSIEVEVASNHLIDALYRLLEVSQNDLDSKILFPQILKEVHYRLLQATSGGMLRDFLKIDSHASNIQKAITLIRNKFHTTISIPEIAKSVGMSTSSFHQHFKSITELTPLQYQKDLRLIEARRLILSGSETVTQAALKVGYESPNQFSREYTRKFSINPSVDAKNESN